jgi:serine O-acetyltransferase
MAVIGDRVHIDQGVTIGGNATSEGVPRVEDDVYIGAGAKLLGPILIGRGSVIGANAVVVKDVPQRSVVAGVPAVVIREDIEVRNYLYHRRSPECDSK